MALNDAADHAWYIVYVFIEILAGSLRGVGDVIVPVVITLFGVCVFRIIWLIGVMQISPTIRPSSTAIR